MTSDGVSHGQETGCSGQTVLDPAAGPRAAGRAPWACLVLPGDAQRLRKEGKFPPGSTARVLTFMCETLLGLGLQIWSVHPCEADSPARSVSVVETPVEAFVPLQPPTGRLSAFSNPSSPLSLFPFSRPPPFF